MQVLKLKFVIGVIGLSLTAEAHKNFLTMSDLKQQVQAIEAHSLPFLPKSFVIEAGKISPTKAAPPKLEGFGKTRRIMAAKLAIASLLEKDEKQKDALITKLEFHSCGNNAVMFWTGEKLKAVVVLDSELKIVSTRIIDARTLEVASEAI